MRAIMHTYYRDLVVDKQPSENGWVKTKCPFHDDTEASLSVNVKTGGWRCFAGCGHGSYQTFQDKQGGKSLAVLDEILGQTEPTIVYNYVDEKGTLLYQRCRYETESGKTFKDRYSDGRGGWIWSSRNIRKVLYNLPNVVDTNNKEVYFVEGEKKADLLNGWGLCATTVGGVNNWRADFIPFFKDKIVYILPDNDDPGHKFADQVAHQLSCVAEKIHIVYLPNLEEKEDVIDWVGKGGSLSVLQDVVATTPAVEVGEPLYYHGQALYSAYTKSYQNDTEVQRPMYGWRTLDALTGGLRVEHLTVVAAKTGGFKSTFMINIAHNMLAQNCRILFISPELSLQEQLNRMASLHLKIDCLKIDRNLINEEERARVDAYVQQVSSSGLFFFSGRGYPDLGYICQVAKLVRPDVIFVDYLQRCCFDGQGTDAKQIGTFLYGLENLGKQIRTRFIVGSQLNRSIDSDKIARKPRLSDLRDSGCTEQAAKSVFFLFQPESSLTQIKTVDLMVLKQTNGPLGDVWMEVNPMFMEFKEKLA